MVKNRLWKGSEEAQEAADPAKEADRNAALWTLKTVLSSSLKLLHPFMPFITEEIYCNLNEDEESIMISSWPVYEERFAFTKEEREIEEIKEAVRAIRQVRTTMNVAPGRQAAVYVVSEDQAILDSFANSRGFFTMLARASEVILQNSRGFFTMLARASEVFLQKDKTGIADDAVSAVIPGATIYIPFSDLVDVEKELARLSKEEERLNGEIRRSNGMLKNEKFISKAPAAKVEEERGKLAKYEQMLKQVQEQLAHLKK